MALPFTGSVTALGVVPTTMDQFVTLPADSNQARGIAEYALDMVQGRHAGAERRGASQGRAVSSG